MIYINAFLVCGVICLIGEIILDNTKLTPGHITSLFVVIGAILSFLVIYDTIKEISFVGASVPITSFGHSLYQAALEGFNQDGFIGMFANLLSTTSAGISAAVFFGFMFALLFRVRD